MFFSDRRIVVTYIRKDGPRKNTATIHLTTAVNARTKDEAGMNRLHIAFISFPHYPHVNPTLPIAAVLARRGHLVSYASSDQFKSRVEKLGVDFISCPRFNPLEMFNESTGGSSLDLPVCRLAVRTLATLTPIYTRNRPDLII